MTKDGPDPRDLIAESYRIDGITPTECRSIFFDWALSVPQGQDPKAAIATLLARHEPHAPAHPMTQVLREGLAEIPSRRQRRHRRSGDTQAGGLT